MSPSGKGLGLAVVCLGVVTATAVWKYAASEGQQPSTGTAGVKPRSTMEADEAATAPAAAPAAPPLAIAPAPAGSKALIVCREGAEEASVAEQWATRSRGGGATVSVCPPGYLDSHGKTNAGAYDSIVVEAWEGLPETALAEVVKLLKAGGKVNVAFQGDGDAAAAVKRALTFAGFLRVAPCPEEARVLTGERAAWEAGASAPVRLSFGGGKPAETSNGSQNGSQNGGGGVATSNGGGAKKTWKLALDDDEDGDAGGDDLVDEDALLESSAPVKRATEVDGGGCATKRRACKGCSCGRAEMEMNGEANGNGGGPVVSIGDVDDALTSACGNCSKGDAFRCAGCPFLGKPAFEKGQEKTIMLSDLDAQQDD